MNNQEVFKFSNCKNCGSPKDIYRTSCEYCDTYYDINDKNEKLNNNNYNNKQYELFKQTSPSGVFLPFL